MRHEKIEIETTFGVNIISVTETEIKKNGSEKISYQGIEAVHNNSEFNLSIVRELYRTFSKSIKKAYDENISLSEWLTTLETTDQQVMLFANLKGSTAIQDKLQLVDKFIQTHKKAVGV